MVKQLDRGFASGFIFASQYTAKAWDLSWVFAGVGIISGFTVGNRVGLVAKNRGNRKTQGEIGRESPRR